MCRVRYLQHCFLPEHCMSSSLRPSQLLLHAAVWSINLLFLLKYSARFSAWYPAIALFYLALYALYVRYGKLMIEKISAGKLWLCAGAAVMLWGFVLGLIPKESLHVDRWMMIHTFWDNTFEGVYSYIPRYNQSIPSQLPVYHLLALPFYLIGEVGIMPLVVLVAFLYFLHRYGVEQKSMVFIAGLLVLMPGLWWEAAARSTIIMNMLLAVMVIEYVLRTQLQTGRQLLIAGLSLGAVAATRGTVILPLTTFFVWWLLKQGRVRVVLVLGALALAVVLLSLLPLYWWKPEDFWRYNPLGVQAYFTNTWFSMSLIIAAVIGGMLSKTMVQVYAVAAFVTVCSTALLLQLHLRYFGLYAVIFESKFDISYFLQAIPFLLMALLYAAAQYQDAEGEQSILTNRGA